MVMVNSPSWLRTKGISVKVNLSLCYLLSVIKLLWRFDGASSLNCFLILICFLLLGVSPVISADRVMRSASGFRMATFRISKCSAMSLSCVAKCLGRGFERETGVRDQDWARGLDFLDNMYNVDPASYVARSVLATLSWSHLHGPRPNRDLAQ
jgi:hypothetical protein